MTPGNPDPVDAITGMTTSADVPKSQFTAYEKQRSLGVFTTASEVRSFDLSGRSRIIIASRFFRKDTSDTSADDLTEASAVVVDGAGNHWLVLEGERYDLQYGATGMIGDGEGLNPGFAPLNQPLELPAGLPGSFFCAIDAVPAAQAVFTFKKSLNYGLSWSNVFTATIAAGQRLATLSLAADVSLPAGAILRPYGPATHDTTLQTVGGVIAARR